MYLKMIRKCFLIALLIFSQYLTSVQSSAFKEHQLNKLSDELLISGWNPFLDKINKGKKANEKTIKTLSKFKKMTSLKPYFKKARGYAVFPNVGKGAFGIGVASGEGEVLKKEKLLDQLNQLKYQLDFN